MREIDNKFMYLAINEAKKARSKQEVPVGAVLAGNLNEIISRGHNRIETDNSSCSHAEILTIIKASKKLKSWRLNGCTMYVTLEPCIMCMGAIINSRISRLIYGATDPKGDCRNIAVSGFIPYKLDIIQADREIEHICAGLIKDFFKEIR